MLEAIKSNHPEVTLNVYETDYGIRLDKIVVRPECRGKGIGTQVLREILSYAETAGKPVALTPDSVYGTPRARLEKWYKSLGFQRNAGRRKDYRFSDTMIWTPRKDTQR
jgi:GNAT superfamily N-acetyltransferase